MAGYHEDGRQRPVQQRFLHYYWLNEAVHACFALWLYSGLPIPYSSEATSSDMVLKFVLRGSGGLARFVLATCIYACAFCAYGGTMFTVLMIRRHFRASNQRASKLSSTRLWRYPDFENFHTLARDGVRLFGRRTGKQHKDSDRSGDSKKKRRPVMLLIAPLGQQGPKIYAPLLARYGDTFDYVTWDYRGFFGSAMGGSRDKDDSGTDSSGTSRQSCRSSPSRRILSIADHARDGMDVLKSCGHDKADVVVGHSMGTAVALEMSLLFPNAVGSIILMNGFHGHVFQTAFQPLYRMPFAADAVRGLIELLLSRPALLRKARAIIVPLCYLFLPGYARLFGSPLARATLGDDYLLDFMEQYCGGVTETEENMHSFLRCFQELDAHSVYHLLPQITQPMLLISGFCDLFTPAMQSVEIARRVRHAVHVSSSSPKKPRSPLAASLQDTFRFFG